MSYESLKMLRRTLDEEDDENSILFLLKVHHKYLKEFVILLSSSDIAIEHKQLTLTLFEKIFRMHALSEQEILYKILNRSTNREMRLQSLKTTDENDLAFEIIDELKVLNAENIWTENIGSKIKVLSGLLKSHIKDEENILFPLAEKHLTESQLMDLTDEYIEKCKIHLDAELAHYSSVVPKNDVASLIY